MQNMVYTYPQELHDVTCDLQYEITDLSFHRVCLEEHALKVRVLAACIIDFSVPHVYKL
jgi:hypothetical protein